MPRVRVEQVIEADPQHVLLAGEDVETGEHLSFHVAGDGGFEIAAAVILGERVEVDL